MSLYHFGLVKILVENKLQKKNHSWTWFLVWNQFVEAPIKHLSHEWNPSYCKAKGLKCITNTTRVHETRGVEPKLTKEIRYSNLN
jgi:hypothetical protein